jgi:hypothetical protein
MRSEGAGMWQQEGNAKWVATVRCRHVEYELLHVAAFTGVQCWVIVTAPSVFDLWFFSGGRHACMGVFAGHVPEIPDFGTQTRNTARHRAVTLRAGAVWR